GSGTVIISYDMGPLGPPPSMNELRVYYGPRGTAGSKKIADTGLVSGAATITVPYSSTAPAPTLLEIVFNEPIIRADGNWSYTATVIPDNPGGGGFTKFGSRRLNLQGEGLYSNTNDIKEGVVRVQYDTALGRSNTGTASGTNRFSMTDTAVDPGAALEFS